MKKTLFISLCFIFFVNLITAQNQYTHKHPVQTHFNKSFDEFMDDHIKSLLGAKKQTILPSLLGANSSTLHCNITSSFNPICNNGTLSSNASGGSPILGNFSQFGLDLDGDFSGDESGTSVSISPDGNYLATGAPWYLGTGQVKVFAWYSSIGPSGTWIQQGAGINGENINDLSGTSVSLSFNGSTVAIGEPWKSGNGSQSGSVRIFDWNSSFTTPGAGTWVQRGGDIDGEAAGDESGSAISLSNNGTRVAIGSSENYGNGTKAGHVRVYQWNGSAWVQLGGDIDGEAAFDYSGWSVSLSAFGQSVAIGAVANDGGGSLSGHVRVYEWNGTAWVQKGGDIDGESGGDQSGVSVSLAQDGQTVAIGAPYNDGNGASSGHARMYEWSGTAWVQKGGDIDGELAGDESGVQVSQSYGHTIAIGSRKNNGNGINSGHVRMYSWNGTAWTQNGSDIDGEAAGDESGWAVSLASQDGSKLAVGSPLNDGNGFSAGHTRTYEGIESYSYLWSTGETTETIDSVSAGTYSLTVTDANGATTSCSTNLGTNQNQSTIITNDSTQICQGESAVIEIITPIFNSSYQWLKYGNPIAGATSNSYTANKTGNYRAIVTNFYGCSKLSNIIKITKVGRPPASIVMNGSIPICVGDSVQLQANSGPYTYQWIRNGKLESGASGSMFYAKKAGNHKAMVIDTNGCFRTSNKINVTRHPKVQASINPAGTVVICPPDSVELIASVSNGLAPYNYQWIRYNTPQPGAINSNFYATMFGGYKVVVTDANGCTDKTASTVVQDICRTGFDNTVLNKSFNVTAYPNPFKESLYLQIESDSKESIDIKLMDALGRVIYKQEDFPKSKYIINTSEFNSGIYFVEIIQGNDLMRVKVMKTE